MSARSTATVAQSVDAEIKADPFGYARERASLDRQIATARQQMGEARWAELNAEWGAGNV